MTASAIVASRSAGTASLRALVTEVQFVEQQEQGMDRFAGARRGDESSDESDEDAEDALERAGQRASRAPQSRNGEPPRRRNELLVIGLAREMSNHSGRRAVC